ncbi:C40 family peptidase [Streptomyces sp. O3]
MAAHRKPKQSPLNGATARTALTLALAGAASATAFEGASVAEPRLTPAQVKAKVDKLYQEAEIATEKYNGATEKATAARREVDALQDEAARKTEELNDARTALSSAATAQYRTGGVAPALQLALASDPDDYLERAALADRASLRQAATITGVRKQLRAVDRLHTKADGRLRELRARQAELKRHKATITNKLDKAKRLLSQLTAEERARALEARAAADRARAAEPAPQRTPAPTPAPSAAAKPAAPPAAPRGGTAAPAPSSSRTAQAIAYARNAVGSPYVWGATGPNAFDCSGLTQAAYRSAGVSLPRTTYTQVNAGRRVSRSELAPGDLVFFYSGLSHVGLYIGNGQMIHAPNPSSPVKVSPISSMPFAAATRVV